MPIGLATPQTLPVKYTDAATLGPNQTFSKIVFTTTGGVTVFQVAKLDQSGKAVFDTSEAEVPAGTWGFEEIYGIKFRSRDAGTLATIDPCTGYFEDDPNPFNPGNLPGLLTSVTGAVNVQHNDALVASQPTLDFEDSVLATFVWTVANDSVGTRVKVTPPDVVTSVFGRQGVVTAQSGDYTAAQVTNAADKSSAATQTFTGDIISGTPTPLTIGSGPGTQMHTTGTFASSTSAATGAAFTATVVGDTTDYRFKILITGEQRWAAQNTAFDTQLTRMAAGILGNASNCSFSTGPTGVNPTGSQTAGILVSTNADMVGFAAANQTFIACAITTDTQFRFVSDYNGLLKWGPGGSTATEIFLGRTTIGSTGILSLTGTAIDNGSLQMSGNVFEGFKTSAQAATSTYTPDALSAKYHTLTFATAGGTLTLANPTNPPTSATHTGTLIIRIVTSATGATTMSYGSQYVAGGTATLPASIAAATEKILTFQADYTTGSILWRLVAIV